MTEKRLWNILKPSILINAFKIGSGEMKISENYRRRAYIIEYGSDAMEYRRDDFYD